MASDLKQTYFILFVKSSFINSILEDKTFVAKDKIQGLFDTTNRYCLYSKYVNIAVNTGHKLFKSKTCSLNSTIFQVAIHFIPPTVVMYVRFFVEIAMTLNNISIFPRVNTTLYLLSMIGRQWLISRIFHSLFQKQQLSVYKRREIIMRMNI